MLGPCDKCGSYNIIRLFNVKKVKGFFRNKRQVIQEMWLCRICFENSAITDEEATIKIQKLKW